jgi:D-psicose/D-tagatose/L-ribulose 3-epimerase
MKYGINTLLWTAGFDTSHLDLLPKIKEAGFDGVEIARFSFSDFPAASVRRALQANQLECTFCSALTGQLCLASAGDEAISYLRDAIHCAADVGAKVLAGPFCSAVGYLPGRRRTPEEWRRAIEGVNRLIPTLEETGVTLAIEPLNRFETHFLNTAADARALCDAVNHPRVGVLFDTFHANIEEKSVSAALRTLGPCLKHVHTCENDRGIPGTGHVAWAELRDGLRELQYDGWVVIESFGFAIQEIAAAACIWRDLAPTPDEIASEGVKYLRALFRTSYAGQAGTAAGPGSRS